MLNFSSCSQIYTLVCEANGNLDNIILLIVAETNVIDILIGRVKVNSFCATMRQCLPRYVKPNFKIPMFYIRFSNNMFT